MKRLQSFFLSIIITTGLTAQISGRFQAPFFQSGAELLFPLVGGINLPELSEVDLNNDGVQDIYLFDKIGNRQLFFERLDNEEGLNFRFAPEYETYFPKLKEWVLLRDYNGDGVQDIFAFSDQGVGGIIVFTGYYEDDTLRFERFNFNETLNLIFFPVPGTSSRAQVYVSKIDYPSIDDVDCDGDLDIITFAGGGKNIQWFRNTSVENGYGLDSLIFVLEDNCWGGIFESGISNEVDLAAAPGECANDYRSDDIDFRHTGSTLLTFDGDDDGDRELLLGDISFPDMTFLSNGGDCEQTWFNEQDGDFPSGDVPIAIPNFPAAFHLDINNDGKKDLIAANNDILEYGEDYSVCWFYENTGTDEQPVFQLVQRDIFVNQMIDVGSRAHPAVADVNNDGLPDIVLGNQSKYTGSENRESHLFLYLNVGTPIEPAFELIDTDFLQLSQFAGTSHDFAPTFGDLDDDGDLDIIIGDVLGKLYYGENVSQGGGMMQVASFIESYQGINIGFNAVPQLVDANRDGLLDLLIGESSGNINYFQNQGSAEAAFFDNNEETAPNNWFFGQVDTRIIGYPTGYSSPWLFDTEEGLQLITGSQNGQIELYGDIDDNFTGIFPILNENLGNIKEGQNTQVTLADLNNDDLLELIIGNQSGGISIYSTTFPGKEIIPTNSPAKNAFPFDLYPNPGENNLYFHFPEGEKQVKIYNQIGKIVKTFNTSEMNTILAVKSLPFGVYFVRVQMGGGVVCKRWLKGKG